MDFFNLQPTMEFIIQMTTLATHTIATTANKY